MGCLIYKTDKRHKLNKRFTKINVVKKKCIDSVYNPFLSSERKSTDNKDTIIQRKWLLTAYAKLITFIALHCYPLVNLLAHIRLNAFKDAGDASRFYYSVYPDLKKQRILCLPRAIFTISTSKRFKDNGVMFIGTFLPTVRMHAWVMEDGMPADVFDDQWICYQPVMMIL